MALHVFKIGNWWQKNVQCNVPAAWSADHYHELIVRFVVVFVLNFLFSFDEMPYCCVPNCFTGYNSDRKRRKIENLPVPSLFRAPNEEALLEWSKYIKRDDRPLSLTDSFCSLHFKEEFICREFKTKIREGEKNADGTVASGDTYFTIKRTVPVLLPGAVPTIFDGCPSYCNEEKKRKGKRSTKRSVKTSGAINSVAIINGKPEDIPVFDACENNDLDTIAFVDNIESWCSNISLPNKNWIAYKCTENVAFLNVTLENTPNVLNTEPFANSN